MRNKVNPLQSILLNDESIFKRVFHQD